MPSYQQRSSAEEYRNGPVNLNKDFDASKVKCPLAFNPEPTGGHLDLLLLLLIWLQALNSSKHRNRFKKTSMVSTLTKL